MAHDETEERAITGRAAVRALFIQPLQGDGLRRLPGETVDAHEAFLARLIERLAYLDPAMLITLREIVLGLAEGPRHDRWPAFATIVNLAARLRQPPDDERHIMTSWLRSVEGPRALEGGYLVELHSHLRRSPIPPGPFDMSKIRERAADNARTRIRYGELVAAGRATPEQSDWLNGYLNRLAYCTALVADGQSSRDQKQNQLQQGAA